MKLGYTNAGTIVSSEGVQTTSSFNIARTPHMFNILSSGLYSDKIGAVLREISCNAMDAHIMAGRSDLPFQVKLPTPLDRSFYVKDWGPGLSDQQVRELYTTYGWSSKQNDDNVTGAFGLGSKSPFAYTMENEEDADGFTVVAVKDGVKRVYTCHIGDDGGPAISRLFEGPADADWQNGVMVTFPVQKKDIQEFHRKAADIFRWFKVKPEVLGLDSKVVDPEFEFEGSFFKLKPKEKSVDNGGPQVIMGNVRYPVNASRLGSLSKTENALLASNVHLFVPIGTVMMTPSREELQYTDLTRTSLKQKLGEAAVEMAKRIREDVLTPEATQWAWYKKIQSYFDTLPYGIQASVKEFLSQAGVSSDEIDTITRVVQEKVAKVPHWAGDGMEGKKVPHLRDATTKQIVLDAAGLPTPDPAFDARSCRVWYYERNSEGRARRREVVLGKIRSGSDYTAVNLRFLANVKVYYTDSTAADARVRAQVADKHVDEALLVVACKGTPGVFAKEYAERLVKDKSLDGLPLEATSGISVPERFLEDKKRRKELKTMTPAEIYAEEEVKFFTLGSTTATDTELGELEDEGDKFFLVCTDPTNLRSATFRNSIGDHAAIGFNGYYREEVSQALKVVVKKLGLNINGAVLVPRESAARRLKLAEQGYKPLLPTIVDAIKNTDNWKLLTANIDRTPDVDLTEMYRADDYGWMGILGHHAQKMTAFWKKFFGKYGTSPVAGAVLEFATKTSKARAARQSDEGAIGQALLQLNNRLSNFSIPVAELGTMPYYEIRKNFDSKAPSFTLLHEGNMINLMASDKAADHDKALRLIAMALEMDSLMDENDTFDIQMAA